MAQAPFVINPQLTAIAIRFGNTGRRQYIADQAVPRTRVTSPEFTYTSYALAEAFTVPDAQVGRRSRPNEVSWTASEATGAVKDYALDSPVPFRDQMAAQAATLPFNLRAQAARLSTDKVMLNRELRAATLLFSAANYQTGYKLTTLSGTDLWTDQTSDPYGVFQDARDAMLTVPNVAVMGAGVYNALRGHEGLSTKIGGSAGTGRLLSNEELADILEVERIIVGRAKYQTSKKGQTLTTANIWGNHVALISLPELNEDGTVINPEEPGFGYTFQWNDRVAGEINDPDMGMYGGVRVRSGESVVEQIINPYAGYFIQSPIG